MKWLKVTNRLADIPPVKGGMAVAEREGTETPTKYYWWAYRISQGDEHMAFVKQASDIQSASWQITINNPEVHGLSQETIIENLYQLNPEYFCMGEEIGEKGTRHIHIYFKRKSALRFTTIKNRFPAAHIERAIGTAWQNREYITKTGKWADTKKSETTVEGSFYEWGELPIKKSNSQDKMREILHLVKNEKKTPLDIIEKYPEMALRVKNLEELWELCIEEEAMRIRKVEVIYISGATGTGKTKGIYERHSAKDICRITDYPRNNGVRFDAYHGQPVLVFEEFASQVPIQQMLNYLDIYPLKLPARYTDRSTLYTTVYITSNIPLAEQYKDVQAFHPEVWKAFLRRIQKVYRYEEDGTIKEVLK